MNTNLEGVTVVFSCSASSAHCAFNLMTLFGKQYLLRQNLVYLLSLLNALKLCGGAFKMLSRETCE